MTMLNILKHKEIMNRILLSIYWNSKLAPFLAFKWWTACMYFYWLPRFSTDLDFDLLDQLRLEDVQKEIRNILKLYWDIKDEYLRDNTVFFLLTYWINDMNIKIEISRRQFPNEYEIVDWNGFSIKIMKKPFILAHKMVALTDRNRFAHRDVFDIYFFLTNNWKWESEIIRLRTGLSDEEYIKKMINFLEVRKWENLLIWLWSVLSDNKQKFFVKNKLMNELITYLKWFL